MNYLLELELITKLKSYDFKFTGKIPWGLKFTKNGKTWGIKINNNIDEIIRALSNYDCNAL